MTDYTVMEIMEKYRHWDVHIILSHFRHYCQSYWACVGGCGMGCVCVCVLKRIFPKDRKSEKFKVHLHLRQCCWQYWTRIVHFSLHENYLEKHKQSSLEQYCPQHCLSKPMSEWAKRFFKSCRVNLFNWKYKNYKKKTWR